MRAKAALLLATITLLGLSLVKPLYLHDQLFQHVPTTLALIVLAFDIRKNWLTTWAFASIVAFIWLHVVGARYVYSFVPYDRWSDAILGVTISEQFGWRRNHYDRLVHLWFGALFLLPISQAAKRFGRMSASWAISFGLLGVMTCSALYEVFEWLLTLGVAPQHAEVYNGQQGDLWDAQKDMGLAFCGSLAVAVLARRFASTDPASVER